MPASLLVAFDIASAALFVAVGTFFLRVWRASGASLDLLVASGFALVGVSYLTTTASEFQLGTTDAWDYPRIAGQLGGTLVIALAYSGHRRERREKAFWALGWAVALVATLIALLFALRLVGLVPSLRAAFPEAHAAMAVSWAFVAANAARAWARSPAFDSALAPLAFAALAVSKYTWVLIDLSTDTSLVPFVYGWRFAALGLLLAALFLPSRTGAGAGHAAA
jgi:hypothetical protein